MRLLLDTHAFLWLDSEPQKLSSAAAGAIKDPANQLVLSVASVWEMEIKRQIGKLRLAGPLAALVESQRTTNRIELLPVELGHVLALGALPVPHKDPFDRLIAAQAAQEGLTLVTSDPIFRQYPVNLLW